MVYGCRLSKVILNLNVTVCFFFLFLGNLGGARKKSVKFAMEPETVIPESTDDRIKKLEEALESAAKERQEILEAAEQEIEYHRSIAGSK